MFGARFHQRREQANLTIAQITDAIGIAPEELEAIERGAHEPTATQAEILTQALRRLEPHGPICICSQCEQRGAGEFAAVRFMDGDDSAGLLLSRSVVGALAEQRRAQALLRACVRP